MPSWKKVITSGSDAVLNSLVVTGSVSVTGAVTASIFSGSSYIGSHTGSLLGTASWAQNASAALSAPYITGSGNTNRHSKFTAFNTIGDSLIYDDGTNIQITGSSIIVSGASTAFIVTGSVRSLGGFTGSLFGTASYVSGSVFGLTNPATSASYSITSSFATTASFAQVFPYAGTAQINGNVGISGSFSVTGSTIINTQQNATVNIGTSVVAAVPTSSMYAAFFDYVARSGSETQNMRAGTVMSVWSSNGSIQYTDNSTPDVGDTSGVTLATVLNASNVELRATVTTNNWNIKTFVRSI